MNRLFIIIGVFFVALLLSGASSAAAEDLFIAVEGEALSARVEEFPLKAVAEKIESKTGIWFKAGEAGEALLQEKVSVAFNGLPLEAGLERILSTMNYSFVFDGEDELVGVFLFRSLDPRQKQVISRSKARARTRVAPRPVRYRHTIPTRRPQPFRN